MTAIRASTDVECGRWQRSRRDRAVRCCTMRWSDEYAGAVTAAVAVGPGDSPQAGVWAIAAEAEEGWSAQALSPLRRLGWGKGLMQPAEDLVVPTDALGLGLFDVGVLGPDEELLPRTMSEDGRVWNAAVGVEIAEHITDPARSVGVVIATTTPFADRDRISAQMEAALWPGVVTAMLIDGTVQVVVNQIVGSTRALPGVGCARYYPPPLTDAADHVLDAADVASPARLARLVDTALELRSTTPAPTLVECATDLLDPVEPAPASPEDEPVGFRAELDAAQARTAAAEAELQESRRRNQELKRELGDALARLHELEQRPDAQQLIDEAAQLRELNAGLHAEITGLQRDYEDSERDGDQLRVQLARLSGQVSAAGRPLPEDGTDDEPEYETFPQLMQVQLTGVQILADPQHAAKLDSAPKAALWRRRTLQVLRTLSAYVQAKHAARSDGRSAGPNLASVFSFVRSQQPGALISMRGVASRESDRVMENPRLASHRYFPVPPEVDATGTLMYVAHIAIGSGRNLAPRLYFHDDTDGPTGLVYVGYIGPHLPNIHTS